MCNWFCENWFTPLPAPPPLASPPEPPTLPAETLPPDPAYKPCPPRASHAAIPEHPALLENGSVACANPVDVTMYVAIAITPTTIGMIPFCLTRDSFNLFYRIHE